MAGTGTVDAQQHLDRLDVLARNLLQRRFADGDLIGGTVGARVTRTQHARHRLARLVAVGKDRMKAVAALEVSGGALFVGVACQQRRVDVDRDLRRRPGEIPYAHARSRVRALKRLEHARRRCDLVDHPKRRRVRRDRPEQIDLVTDRAQIGEAVATVGEHHRQITDHPPRIVAGVALTQPRQLV